MATEEQTVTNLQFSEITHRINIIIVINQLTEGFKASQNAPNAVGFQCSISSSYWQSICNDINTIETTIRNSND